MRTVQQFRSTETDDPFEWGESDPGEDEPEGGEPVFRYAIRVTCPTCAQPVALAETGTALPQHALCPTPWNPFGLTVCPGSGGTVPGEAAAGGEAAGRVAGDPLVTLPETLDWRLQPFSHVGGPGTRPMRMPGLRQAA